MAKLEGEALILGIWRNVEELESVLNLPELEAIISAAREKEMRHHKFMAALKGLNLDDDDSAKERVEEIKRRAEAKRLGTTTEALEFNEFGIDFEEEE